MIQTSEPRARERGAEREPRPYTEGTEGAGIEPAERRARMHHIGGSGHEIAAVCHQQGVVRGRLLQRPEQCDRIDVFALLRRLRIDLHLALLISRAQLRKPICPACAVARRGPRQVLQEQTGVADGGDVGPAVQAGVSLAAVGRDEFRTAPHMLAVVEPEVARHAGQQHAIGLTQGRAALVPHLQRMVAPQQAAGHAR